MVVGFCELNRLIKDNRSALKPKKEKSFACKNCLQEFSISQFVSFFLGLKYLEINYYLLFSEHKYFLE